MIFEAARRRPLSHFRPALTAYGTPVIAGQRLRGMLAQANQKDLTTWPS